MLDARFAHYAPNLRLSSHASRIFADEVFGFGLIAVCVAVLLGAVWAWARARQLGEEVWKRRGLRSGPALLPGVAHPLDERHGAEHALIELTIEQEGKQVETKSGPHVHWRETSRRLVDRPFLLRTDGGDEVHVEPQGRVVLIDRLMPPVRVRPGVRHRIARIDPGERVWIRGVLSIPAREAQGPYRDGGAARPTLRPDGTRPLSVSSEPVDNELLASARFHFLFAVLFATAFALSQGVLFRPYHALRSGGQVTEATVTDHRRWITRNKSSVTEHYALGLEFECPTGHALVYEETNGVAFARFAEGATVPVVFLPSDPTLAQIGSGDELGTTQARTAIATGVSSFLLFIYMLTGFSRRPWWRRDKLHEVEKNVLV